MAILRVLRSLLIVKLLHVVNSVMELYFQFRGVAIPHVYHLRIMNGVRPYRFRFPRCPNPRQHVVLMLALGYQNSHTRQRGFQGVSPYDGLSRVRSISHKCSAEKSSRPKRVVETTCTANRRPDAGVWIPRRYTTGPRYFLIHIPG